MRISLNVDVARGLLRLKKGEKRMAFAIVNAINTTAKVIQKAEQESLRRRFTVRRSFTVRQAAVIKPFASVGKAVPYAEIRVGQKERLLLSRYEEGGRRPTASGTRSAAVPIIGEAARPSFARSVPRAYQLESLALASDIKTRQIKGRRRTFILFSTAKAPLGGVFKRVGKERDDIRMIYSFKRDQQLDDRLHFVETATGVSRRLFPTLLRAEVAKAFARG